MLIDNHGLGRKSDSPDPRDHMFSAHRVLLRGTGSPLPPSIDLRKKLLPVWDQGKTNSCGGHAGAALMAYFDPEVPGGFSALQIYYAVREIEGDVNQDDGVETRDVLKVLTKLGAAPVVDWAFDASKVLIAPPKNATDAAALYKLDSYSRLVSESDYLGCLADGFPFVLGFEVPESLDSDQLAHTGIMQMPDLSKEKIVGGHDVLIVGYDRTFKRTPFFEASGIDPSKVDDTMLLVRNSWGSSWSPNFRGHFWMPLSYALNPSTGGDAWTGRVAVAAAAASPDRSALEQPTASPAQVRAAFVACRIAIDATGYGGWVSDDKLHPISDAVANAVVRA